MNFNNNKQKDNESRILTESYSPNCSIKAIVEEDDRCVYFYLFGDPTYGDNFLHSCWVRNYDIAPKDTDIEAMKSGIAPVLPAEFCAHPNGAEKLKPSDLEIVWFEEGDGAALLYDNVVLSIIPSWSNSKCPGYSKDCIIPSQFAWPLGNKKENVLYERVEKAKMFWNKSRDGKLWKELQDNYLQVIEDSIGKYDRYYAIDGGHWPPKALITIEKGNLTYIITIGVSIIPQPKVEMYHEYPELYRRIELGFAIENQFLHKNKDGILSYISGQTSLPWSCLSWFGHGHTIPCDQIWPNSLKFPYVMLVSSNEIEEIPNISFPQFEKDLINILWMVPITEKEKNFAQINGSKSLLELSSENIEKVYIFNNKRKFDVPGI